MAWQEDSDDDPTLIHDGRPIRLTDLQRCQAALEDHTRNLLAKLLRGYKPAMDISKLRDRVGNINSDCSICEDPSNREVIGPVDQLATYFRSTPALQKEFGVPLPGSYASSWKPSATRGWLGEFSQLNILCIVQVIMNCGAPGRTTELTSMEIKNTHGGMSRSMRIIRGCIVLVRRYLKTRGHDGHDRSIPHTLNAALGAVLIYLETICRPFAQICAHVLSTGQGEEELYRTRLFVGPMRPISGDMITAEMKFWTEKYLGQPLGVRLWRQISTPLRNRLVGLSHNTLARDYLESVNAAQAGHSLAVEQTHYGLKDGRSQHAMADLMEASQRWHRVLRLVSGECIRWYAFGRSY